MRAAARRAASACAILKMGGRVGLVSGCLPPCLAGLVAGRTRGRKEGRRERRIRGDKERVLGGNVEGTRRELHRGDEESKVMGERREETTHRRRENTLRFLLRSSSPYQLQLYSPSVFLFFFLLFSLARLPSPPILPPSLPVW